jgi:hypothetical protein
VVGSLEPAPGRRSPLGRGSIQFVLSRITGATNNRVQTGLPFDNAMITLVFSNLCFYITKGRAELNLSVAPSRARDDSLRLNVVLAALDGRDISESPPISISLMFAIFCSRVLKTLIKHFRKAHIQSLERSSWGRKKETVF